MLLPGVIFKRWLGRLLAAVWIVAVIGVSMAAGARPAWVRALAASPDRIREGKVWFLFSSAALVDRPVVLSLLSFAALAALALIACGTRTFWLSAFLGQVVATLLVYVFIGAARWIVPGAFAASVVSPDFGVSTISAAWLGSIAAVAWGRRGRGRVGRLSIALSCLAVGLFAYSVRPDVTILSSEHLVAFGLGVGVAIPKLKDRLLEIMCRRPCRKAQAVLFSIAGGRMRPIPAAMLSLLPLVVAIAAVPSGLAALRHEVAIRLPPTVDRCAGDWNRLSPAVRPAINERSVSLTSVATIRRVTRPFTPGLRAPVWAKYCRYAFIDRERTVVVLGLWRRGRVDRWSVSVGPRTGRPPTGNAILQSNGDVRLLDRNGRRLILSS